MTLQTSLNEINLILEVLKELNCLVEMTPELQEARQQIIREFRIRMINLVLGRLKGMNWTHEEHKDKF